MINAVTSALGTVLDWVGEIISSLTTAPTSNTAGGALYSLLPLFAIGIAISAVLLGIKIIKSIVWGS